MAKALLGDVVTPVTGTVGTIVIERASTVLYESEEDRKHEEEPREAMPAIAMALADEQILEMLRLGEGILRENLERVEACEVTGEY